MSKYSYYSKSEAADILIIEKYKENIISNPLVTELLTRVIVNSSGNSSLCPLLMMAKVNILILNGEYDEQV